MFRLLAVLACVSAVPLVRVQWYGEALCPGCHDVSVSRFKGSFTVVSSWLGLLTPPWMHRQKKSLVLF